MPQKLLAAIYLFVVVGPVSPLVYECFKNPPVLEFSEWPRLFELLLNTLGLAGLVLILTLPLSVFLALEWYGLPERRRRIVELFLGFCLFLPLPFLASAWQSSFEKSGLMRFLMSHLGLPGNEIWQPWKRGIWIAALIHSVHLIPWATFILVQSLRSVPDAMREEISLLGTVRNTSYRLLLPLLIPAIRFAGVWCVLQVSTEIVVTDIMVVRTFAEEVYTQAVLGVDLAQEAIRTLPWTLLIGGFFIATARRFPRWQPGVLRADEPISNRSNWKIFLFALFFAILLLAPVAELINQFYSRAETDQSVKLSKTFSRVWQTYSLSLFSSAGYSCLTAGCCCVFAILLLNGAEERSRRMKLVFFISVLCMALPGPVLGFSAKAFFSWLCDLEERMAGRNAPLQILLYDGPSVLPVIWVHIIKFLPIALALQYSLYRAIPPAILETARLEGVSKSWRLRKITWPQVRSGFFLGILAISLLSFGEVSTGKIVETPACTPFSQELFNQMHYGVSTTVVALSLMQIGMLSLLYVGSLLSYRWFFAGNTSRPASGRDE